MGVGLNTMLAAVGAGGVASSKIATSMQIQGISESNDGQKAKQMADKSRKNLQALKQAKLNIRKIRIDNSLTDRQKSIKINKEINKLGGNE